MTATALQEKAGERPDRIVLGLAILFAYLFLVALYESWNIPIPVASVRSRSRCSARSARWRGRASP